MPHWVAKFGGSSVKDARAFKNCFELVSKRPEISLIVVSATYNTTNELEQIFELAKEKRADSFSSLDNLFIRHEKMADELEIINTQSIVELKKEGQNLISLIESGHFNKRDQLLSLGERLSSFLFSQGLQLAQKEKEIALFDAREIIKTDSCFSYARPNLPLKCGKRFLSSTKILVTQGFIGENEKGETTTLGREGSDYSATLLADTFEADGVYILSDVNGIYRFDPRIITECEKIEHISYEHASLMAQFGAKVLFPETLAPVRLKKIPVIIGNSQSHDQKGTLINDNISHCGGVVGMALESPSDQLILTLVGENLEELENSLELSLFEKGPSYIRYKIKNIQFANEIYKKIF